MSSLEEKQITFKITAPGRIVLCGESGVMFGKCVVLAGLNLQTYLDFFEIPVDLGKIIIYFSDVDLMKLEIPMKLIVNFRSIEHFTTLISDHLRFAQVLQHFLTTNGMWETYEQRYSLQIFFFLLMHIATYEELNVKPFFVEVNTELSNIGIDLGSLSSFAVCLSACFIHWSCVQRGTNYQLNEEKLNRIMKYAKLAEKVLRDDVFETDIDVCCYGSIIKFKYDTEQDEYSIEKIHVPNMISIMLVDLKNESVVEDRMRQIAETYCNRTEDMRQFLDWSNNLSIQICEILEHIYSFFMDNARQANIQFSNLKELIEQYERFLTELNLLDENLQIVCSITKSIENCAGMIAGYENKVAYILLLPAITSDQTMELQIRLENANFSVIGPVYANCDGLKINDSID